MKQYIWYIKKYGLWIILAIVAVVFDVFLKQFFYTIFVAYGFFIKLLLSEFITKKTKRILAVLIWSLFIAAGGLMFYVNNYMPRGSMYNTGDVVCQNDDRGPCAEKYIEDMQWLNIPEWAKFFRTSSAELLMFGLLFAGMVAGVKGRNQG